MLTFCYERITKLDLERKYCKFYSRLLLPFKETSAYFKFFYEGRPLDVALDAIVISDIVVPGDVAKTIEERNGSYNIKRLVDALCEEIGRSQ